MAKTTRARTTRSATTGTGSTDRPVAASGSGGDAVADEGAASTAAASKARARRSSASKPSTAKPSTAKSSTAKSAGAKSSRAKAAGTKAAAGSSATKSSVSKASTSKAAAAAGSTAGSGTAKSSGRATGAKRAGAKQSSAKGSSKSGTAARETVLDETAPGAAPVTVSATEARASEPVMTDEGALAADAPPPAGTPAPTDHSHTERERAHRIHDGDMPVQADTTAAHPSALTGDPGEPEHNAAAHVPAAGERTEDGTTYADVAHPRNPTERMQKRELELGAEMDYVEHRKTYSMFLEGAKWGTAIIIGLLIAMAVGFFTAGGVMGGLVMFLGALLAGYWFLR